MRKIRKFITITVLALAMTPAVAVAGPLADEVAALQVAVDAQQVQINAQQAQIDALLSQLAALESNPALQLGPYVRVDENELIGVSGPNIIFEGANMHLQSGSGYTNGTPNGLGNLIIGYNEIPDELLPGDRGGMHNFIMGREHKYPSNDSILHGWGSEAQGHATAILAGDGTVSYSTYSAAIGGKNHVIQPGHGVVVGGASNTVNSNYGVVVGGQFNTVTGIRATVTGGQSNYAAGDYSSVSGGAERMASGENDWVAGSLMEEQ